MTLRISRFCLGLAALLALAGGVMHGVASAKNEAALNASNLPAFFAGSAKGLWLADSATLILLALTFGVAAVRPGTATRWSLFLAAMIPVGTALILYRYLGNFFAAHLLMVIAALAVAASPAYGPNAGTR
jgi:hypothetical protein